MVKFLKVSEMPRRAAIEGRPLLHGVARVQHNRHDVEFCSCYFTTGDSACGSMRTEAAVAVVMVRPGTVQDPVSVQQNVVCRSPSATNLVGQLHACRLLHPSSRRCVWRCRRSPR